MLRLMQLGVVPFGTATLTLSMAEEPLLGAPDLAGLNPDMATLRRTVAAYRPVLESQLRGRHGLELLAIYAYPAQVIFCNQAFAKLDDLAGRRVRVSGLTQANLIDAVGGLPVTTTFADLMPRMRAGSLDCAITGAMSGNTIGLHEITSHLHTLAIGWGLAVFAANSVAWGKLSPELRGLLKQQLPLLEQAIWTEADRQTDEGIACNSGAGTCTAGRRGKMVVIRPTTADQKRLRELLTSNSLPRWVARCGARCAEVWNQSIAPVAGIEAVP